MLVLSICLLLITLYETKSFRSPVNRNPHKISCQLRSSLSDYVSQAKEILKGQNVTEFGFISIAFMLKEKDAEAEKKLALAEAEKNFLSIVAAERQKFNDQKQYYLRKLSFISQR